jgi:hypothetical protein
MIAAPRTCRACRGRLDTLYDLGDLHLSTFLLPHEAEPPKAPLILAACAECKLVQLGHTVPREQLFEHYWYLSGVNETMQAELADIVDDAVRKVGPFKLGDVVLDIGANDGTLLQRYRTLGLNPLSEGPIRVAYEPAKNLQHALHEHADVVISDYFPERYAEVQKTEGHVKIITSIAMVYAVDDLAPFLTAIAALLHPDGVWIVQFQDLAGMLRKTAFDNICHEHLCYFSLESFSALLPAYGLRVVDAEPRAINGGSVRLTVRHRQHPVSARVAQWRERERGCQEWATLERFGWQIKEVVRQIRAAVDARRSRGQTVDLYGASTKANTLLQVCQLDLYWLRQAWERSPAKIGRRTAGTGVPIVNEADGRAHPPDALLCGIWQFRDAVLAREAAYLTAGGSIIFPLPSVDVVGYGKVTHAYA